MQECVTRVSERLPEQKDEPPPNIVRKIIEPGIRWVDVVHIVWGDNEAQHFDKRLFDGFLEQEDLVCATIKPQ